MSEAERDAIDIFWLLFPMLSDGQKEASEGRKAARLAEKYRPFSRDSGKIEGYDRILRIVRDQIAANEPDFSGELRGPVTDSRGAAYAAIVRMLGIGLELNDLRPQLNPNMKATPAKKRATESAKKRAAKQTSRKKPDA